MIKLLQKKISIARKIIVKYITAFTELSFQRNCDSKMQLLIVQIYIIINEIQQLELSKSSNQNYFILEIAKFYGVEFLLLSKFQEIQWTLFFLILILYLVANVINFLYMQKFFKKTSIVHHLLILNHYILLYPIMIVGIMNINQNNSQLISIITIILSLKLEIFNIFFNTEYYFIEIEGNYFNSLMHGLNLCLTIVFALVKVFVDNVFLIRIFQILFKLIFCFRNIKKQDKNELFFIIINVIMSIEISLTILNLDWCQIMIYFLLGITIIMAFRQKLIHQMILENVNDNKFLLIQFLNNSNLQKDQQQIISFLQNKFSLLNKNKISFTVQFEIKNTNQKWRYINYLADNHSMKALLAIKSEKYIQINQLQQIKLQILTKRVAHLCDSKLHQSHKLQVVFSSLKQEEQVEQIINKIKYAKSSFLHFLRNEVNCNPLEIIKGLNKMGVALTQLKKQFKSLINLKSLCRVNCKISDILTLNQISDFYQFFYLDSNESNRIKNKIINLIQWDRSINIQLDQYQCIVIQISLLNQFGQIVNLNEKRFKAVFPNIKVPRNIQDIIPNYQKDSFYSYVHDFIENKYQQEWKIKGVIEQDSFVIPCTFDLSYEITADDIVINFLITIDQIQNQLIHFSSDGKILSITRDLFFYFIEKSQNNYLQNLSITEFLSNSMIQFHIEDICNQVVSFQNLIIQGIATQRMKSKWKYPLNYQKCTQKVMSVYTSQTQQNSVRSFQNVLYAYSTKRLFNNFKQIITHSQETDPKIQNIPIKLLKPSYAEQMQKIIIYSKNNYLEVEYDLTFIPQELQDHSQKAIFEISFTEIEGFKKLLNRQEVLLKELNQLDLLLNSKAIKNDDGLKCEQLTKHRGIYKFIKLSFFLILLLIAIIIIFSLINNSSFQSNLTLFEYYYDYSIYPQTITFAYAAIYLNNWNRFCTLQQLYNITELVENTRLGSLEFVNFVFSVNYHQDAIGCYLLSLDIGMETINVENYVDDQYQLQQMNYLEFFDYARTYMDKMHRDNLINYGTDQENYSILEFKGLIRQNLIKIFVFCDIAMEELVQIVLENVNNSSSQFYILQIVSCSLTGTIITIQILLILHSWKWKDKLFQLLSHLSVAQINEILNILDKSNQQSSMLSSSLNPTTTQDSKRKHLIEEKKKLNHSIINYSYISLKSIILPMVYLIVIIGLTITVSILHLDYFQKYQQSLELTFRFVKLKKVFDGSLILGELIKTEYLINKSSLNYINQTEMIEQFFNYTDQLTSMVHSIYEDVESNDVFSQETHQMIVDALSGNLCEKFASFYHFCNISTQYNYSEKDITYQYLAQGISGMIEKYQNLIQNEFSYERETLKYSQNTTELSQYLNTQIHQNIFVQYFYDMEFLVFTNFQYFYAETLYLGQQINYKLGQFYLYSGLMYIFCIIDSTFFIFFIEFIVWSVQETKEISNLRMIGTLFPDTMLQNQTFQRLLVKTFNHLY